MIATRLQQTVAGLLIAGVVLCCAPAQGAPFWYNGDLDNRDAFLNQTSSTPGGLDGLIYDDFVVPNGTTITIAGVFSNDVANPLSGGFPSTTAYWEIRSGVSAGNGGTLIASGDGADTITATGRTSQVFAPFAATEYTNEVDGLDVTLGPGTYWLAVAPDTDGLDNYWDISTTSGANAIGTPPGNDGNSFFSSDFTGDSFTPTASLEGPGNWDYSMGVILAAPMLAAPEPSVVALLTGAGLSLALYGFASYRRKSAIVATPA